VKKFTLTYEALSLQISHVVKKY